MGQIIIDPVIVCVDIDAPSRLWFLKVDIFEGTEGLNVLVGRQVFAVPASAKRTDQRNRGLEEIGLNAYEVNTCFQRLDLSEDEFKAGCQTALVQGRGDIAGPNYSSLGRSIEKW